MNFLLVHFCLSLEVDFLSPRGLCDESVPLLETSTASSIPILSKRDPIDPSSFSLTLLAFPSSEMSPISVHLYCAIFVKKPVPHNISLRSSRADALCKLKAPPIVVKVDNDRNIMALRVPAMEPEPLLIPIESFFADSAVHLSTAIAKKMRRTFQNRI